MLFRSRGLQGWQGHLRGLERPDRALAYFRTGGRPGGHSDPVKYRGSLPEGSIGTHCLVAFSGAIERPDRMLDECVLVQFRLDERYPPHAKCGQITTHLRKPFEDGDQAMVLVKTESWDGVQYHVPIHEVQR